MTNLQDAFIEIVAHHGFQISKQLVSKLQFAGQLTKQNKKAKIGIHFHHHCCVRDQQIVFIENLVGFIIVE